METGTFWVATVAYALATLLVTGGIVFERQRLADIGHALALTGFGAHSLSIIFRFVSTGRLPYVQDYETALAGTWLIMTAYVLLVWRYPALKVTGIVVFPFALLALGYGLTQPSEAGPVVPALKSIWLVIHVLFAWFTYAAYTTCAALAVIELMKTGRRGLREGSLLARTPEVPALQDLTMRLVGFGFIVNTAMIASGAIWAFELWGSYWRWDPVETWSLLTWVAYGLYLHARVTLGWRGRRLAWIAVLALFGVMMSFWGVQFAPTSYHLFKSLGESTVEPGGRF